MDLAVAPAPAPRPQRIATAQETDGPVAAAQDKAVAPAPPPAPPAPADETRPHDAIAQLLLGNGPEAAAALVPNKTVLAAQRALVKLGFVLKPDGVIGATTRQAIERYERDHHRANNGELTPAVLRRLSAESGVPIN